jgi:hypothetical protein
MQQQVSDRGQAWCGKHLRGKCQRNLDQPTIARVQQPRGVRTHEEQANSRAPDRAGQLPKKPAGQAVCSAVVGGRLPPPKQPKEAWTGTSTIRRIA